jgi:hypothetical protein
LIEQTSHVTVTLGRAAAVVYASGFVVARAGTFQPFLIGGAGGAGDAAFIGVGNTSGVSADVDVGIGYFRLEALTRCC